MSSLMRPHLVTDHTMLCRPGLVRQTATHSHYFCTLGTVGGRWRVLMPIPQPKKVRKKKLYIYIYNNRYSSSSYPGNTVARTMTKACTLESNHLID